MIHPHNRAERLALAKKKHGKKPYPRKPAEEDDDAIREEVRREIWNRQDD